MIEKIGNITIDDTHYPGADLYCDGAVEDEILEIVKTNGPSSYSRIIEEAKSWPVLYHLSHLRENIVGWIPVGKKDKVLEVGSGCGAITGALSAKAGSVTCIELSKKRSLINAYRHPDCRNVTIRLGNFQDIEPELACDYDYIFLIGVFEYAQSYIGGSNPFTMFMTILQKHLAPGGRMVIAIENRFGLKYWAGCKEDHLGTYFDGIEGYPAGGGVRTFTRKELEEICHASGVSDYSFYYPYPDYKFMTCLYSDARLPGIGELCNNNRNFDRDRLFLFDEKNVYDGLVREGLFPQFSNSYVLVTGQAIPVSYARFSNDRAPQYAILTEIRKQRQSGNLEVRKIPLHEKAKVHVRKMEDTCRKLTAAYEGSALAVNRCTLDGEEAVFTYLAGRTLEELFDDCLERGDMDGFDRLFEKYREMVEYPTNPPVYNYDMVFSNIIVSGGVWNLIDYEWVSEEKVSAKELIGRALYCYGIGSEKRKEKSLSLIREVMGWREQGAWNETFLAEIVEKERVFQKSATGSRMSMVEIRDAIDMPVVPAVPLVHQYVEKRQRNRIQIYEDYGEGFSEAQSYFLHDVYCEKEKITIDIEYRQGLRAIRLDPALDYCIVQVGALSIGGTALSLRGKEIKLNGKLISDQAVVFATEDPGIVICNGKQAQAGSLHVELEIVRISQKMAAGMSGEEKEKKRGLYKGLTWLSK